jgi:tape measure domain-containing protein
VAERVGGIFYDVSLDTAGLIRGSRVVDRETAKAARAFNAITAAVKLYAAALAVVKSAQLADDMRLLSGRIEVATRNLQEASAAMQALQRISTNTGTSLEANAKVFTRLNQSVLEMGGNQNDTLRITELLGKAIRVSGASTVEAASTMTQFAQAMGSGKLAGDELKSMMENAPYLMRQLAAGLGVPIGALKQLGEEGKLTADVVANALQKAAAQIERDFQKMPQTLGTAFTVATDAAMRANEAFDTLTGTSAALTGATKGVGEVLDNLARQFALATSEGEKLGRNDTVKSWAEGTFTVLSYVIDAGDVVVRTFRNIATGFSAAANAAKAAAKGGFTEAKAILDKADSDVAANNSRQLSGARMRQAAAALAVPDTYANRLDRAAAGGGPASNLTPKGGTTDDKAIKAAKKASEARRKLAQEAAQAELDAEEMAAKDKAEAWEYYDKIQLANAEKSAEARKEMWQQVFDEIDAEQERAIEAGRAFLEAEAAAKKATSEVDMFGKKLAENIQDTLGDGLYDAMTGNFKSIGDDFGRMLLRMLAQAQAADLARAIFGADPKGGLSGGWLGKLGSAATAFLGSTFGGGGGYSGGLPSGLIPSGAPMAIGGGAQAGKLHRVNEKGRPEMFQGADGSQWMMPTRNGRVVPTSAGSAGSGSGGDGARSSSPPMFIIENHGADIQQQQDPSGAMRLVVRTAVAEVDSRMAGGGSTARAAAGRFGLNNGATLNRRRG